MYFMYTYVIYVLLKIIFSISLNLNISI